MNGMQTSIVVVVGVLLGLAATGSAQQTGERTLPDPLYMAGYEIQVTIEMTGEPGSVSVVETPPAGWAIRGTGPTGTVNDGVITWNLADFTGSRTLMYRVTPPSDATGVAVFSGTVGDQEIGGMTTMALWELRPVHLPELTGPYEVGTVSHHLTDESRDETFTPDEPNDKRELMVQFWYPADAAEGAEPGLLSSLADWVARARESSYYVQVPVVYWDGVPRITANALPDAPLAGAEMRYPVLIYSHGHTASPAWQTYTIEELASHGYIVMGIYHPYNPSAMRFPDGRIVTNNGLGTDDFAGIHTHDVRFVLDQLEALNQGNSFDDMFADRLDLSRTGVFGLSLGGRVTGEVLRADSRVKAGASLDSSGISLGFDQPFMNIVSQGNGRSLRSYERALRGGGYECEIAGTKHWDFGEWPLLWRLLEIPGRWPVNSSADDPVRVVRVYVDYTLAFFDRILGGQRVPLLDGPSTDYPEVEFMIIGDPQAVSAVPGFEAYE